jgi:hypothetical protein
MSQAVIATPPVWDVSCYLRPIKAQGGGNMAHTHLAQLRSPDGVICRAYIKHYTEQSPRGLFNEWFGHTLLGAIGIPLPAAAVMLAPRFDALDSPAQWAFVSCEPTPRCDGTPKERYNLHSYEHLEHLRERLFLCDMLPALIAADQLIINGDRNMGNLVFTGAHTFVAIDHGEILGGSNWTFEGLQSTPVWATSKIIESLTRIEHISRNDRSRIYAAAQVMQERYTQLNHELKNYLNGGKDEPHPETAAAIAAIDMRGEPMIDWFRRILNLLA